MIFYKGNLFILELKSHKGKSLPLNCIREKQFIEMDKANLKNNVFPMVIIYFSDIEECYALKISSIIALKNENKTKSISLPFARQNGFKINSRKLQTHSRFFVEDFLENFIENNKKESI